MRYQMANARQLTARASALETSGMLQDDALHYSYWMGEWATVLGLLAQEKRISGYVTRVHGYDLYDERHTLGYQPYRAIQKQGLKKIYPISELGKGYIASRMTGVPLETHYLGTVDHGPGPLPTDETLRVVSVARLVPLKRIREMITILALCQRPVHWTHIGGGPEEELLRTETNGLGKHIQVSIRGDMDHDAIMHEYSQKPYHLLISLSSSEGLPVSMMEAMSFGIPVLSTDVGGVHEMVTESTGVLVDRELDHAQIASILDDWILTGLARPAFREGVRQAWKERFSADRNYPRFIEDILSLEWS
ncbi:MAG: glycosyltransferase [Flavobacteriales bacterium]|nr:glycosyltransferase [Flavobacteriales bacterium]